MGVWRKMAAHPADFGKDAGSSPVMPTCCNYSLRHIFNLVDTMKVVLKKQDLVDAVGAWIFALGYFKDSPGASVVFTCEPDAYGFVDFDNIEAHVEPIKKRKGDIA